MLRFRHHSTTTGAIIATNGVFRTNADPGIKVNARRAKAVRSSFADAKSLWPIQSRTPQYFSPAVTASNAPMVNTAGFAKPWKACSGVMTPVIVTKTRPLRKSTSIGAPRRQFKMTKISPVTASAMYFSICVLLGGNPERLRSSLHDN